MATADHQQRQPEQLEASDQIQVPPTKPTLKPNDRAPTTFLTLPRELRQKIWQSLRLSHTRTRTSKEH